MAKVMIKVRPTGTLNGLPWPEAGQTMDLADAAAASMAEVGHVEILDVDPEEQVLEGTDVGEAIEGVVDGEPVEITNEDPEPLPEPEADDDEPEVEQRPAPRKRVQTRKA